MELVKYNAMCTAIAEAHAVDEAKEIRDQAIAAEAYFKQAKNLENECRAAEIRIRAERKAGQLLKTMEGKGKRGGDRKSSRAAELDSQTLENLKISKGQSSRWQQLADVPEERFESNVTMWKEEGRPPASKRIAKPEKPVLDDRQQRQLEIARAALYFWGELGRMSDKMEAASPSEVAAALREKDESMLSHVCEFLQIVIPYLEELNNECT